MMILCENLVKIYTQTGVDVVALQGLDLDVRSGEMIGIVGESGSGKSTLLNVVGGLDRPTAGNVSVAGRDLLKMSEKELDRYRCTQVGFVWQQTTRNLTPYLSARENVELPMRLTDRPESERAERALALLETVGLADRAHHLPEQLSGGEQQRVAIALALANQPELLLADEPTGELDTMTSLSIYELFKNVNRSFGTTIVIVSHDPNIWRHVDRVVAIRDGKTSTETTRVVDEGPITPEKPAERSEKLLMVDAAGHVQIPELALERTRIGSRVRVEVHEDSVTLHAVEGYRKEVSDEEVEDESLILMAEDPLPEPENSGWKDKLKSWIRRIRQ
jgi:ABC-type lipoprotein export system ATPase subunit